MMSYQQKLSSLTTIKESESRRRLQARTAAILASVGLSVIGANAQAASCPVGSYCYDAPPILPQPTISGGGYGQQLVLAAPNGTISGTYSVNGGPAQPFSVTSGTPQLITLGANQGNISGFKVIEQRGIEFITSSPNLIIDQRMIATFWQSSSTVKSNVIGLGTRFRAGGYTLNNANGDGTGYDYAAFYAPTGANITIAAPPGAPAAYWNDAIVGSTYSFTLQPGETTLIRTNTGVDIDGALITSNNPVAVTTGGRGWASGCGDDGMDQLVPTNLLGTQFVVDDYPSTLAERVRIVADTNGTMISINGSVVATLQAGQYFDPTITGVTFIETSAPAYVFQNAGFVACENDVALIPPVVFVPGQQNNIAFNVIGSGAVNIIIPTTEVASLLLDGLALPSPSVVAVPTHPEWSRVRFNVAAGSHSVAAPSDFQLGLVSQGGGTGLFAYFNPYRLPGCGDGVVSMSEGCDDSNIADGDGCSATCKVETSYECMGQPSVCTVKDTDGDGMSDYIEGLLGYDPLNADADGDGIADPVDLDLDNDGIPNAVECKSQALSLVNGSFEQPPIPGGMFSLINASMVPGWKTTAGDNLIEFWGTGFNGVPSADGNQFVELNANQVSTLYQDLATTPGDVYFYRFNHRGRSGPDTLSFKVGDPAGALLEQRKVTTNNTNWQLVTGVYTVPTGQTNSRFAFESVSSTGGASVGNFLDSITFTPGCKTNTDGDAMLDFRDLDSDGDGLLDAEEAGHGLPNMNGMVAGPFGTNGLSNQVETSADSGVINYTVLDSDNDGTPNFQEVDSDNDGVNDNMDDFPLDPTETKDTDMDGVGDNGDNCVNTPNTNQADTDMNGVGDACQDTDMDGIIDGNDNCVTTPNTNQADMDMNGIGDACQDTDMDGVIDGSDNCVNAPNTNQADADMDGIGDACEGDADSDGIADDNDNCVNTPNMNQADADMDGIGDACEADTDMDGVIDDNDNCVNTANMDQADTDMDGIGDACEADTDMDGVIDESDNCINTPNMDQADADMDGIGDACEADTDMDGIADDDDNCVNTPNSEQTDADMDGIGDACEADSDMDGIADDDDNCIDEPNMDQADKDMDGIGDVCEADTDMDGIPDENDNCLDKSNSDQADRDMNGIGDACDEAAVEGVITSGSGCLCSQAPTSSSNTNAGALAAFGAMLVGLLRKRRKAA